MRIYLAAPLFTEAERAFNLGCWRARSKPMVTTSIVLSEIKPPSVNER